MLGLAVGLWAIFTPVRAANDNWTSTGTLPTNSLWTNTSNWSTSAVPSAAQSVVFNNATGLLHTVSLNGNQSAGSITFSNNGGGGAWTIDSPGSTNTLTLSGGVTNSIAGSAATFNNVMVLSANQSYAATSGALTFGAINLSNTTTARTLTISGSNAVTVGGIIDDGVATSGGTLIYSGTSSLTLSAANTYSGTTTVSSTGTLNINNAGALGTGALIISSTGKIDNTSGAAIVNANNNTQNWNGNFTFTGTNNLDLGTGAVTMNATRQITVTANTLTVGGAISGATFGLTKLGAGTLVLNGVVGTTTGTVTENGGALTLAGANTYSGTTTLTSGTLNFNNASAIGTGGFTITGGTLDNTSGAAITNSHNNTQAWNGNFAFTGTDDLNLGTGAVTMNASRQVTVNGGNLTVGGAISGATFGLTKLGGGTLILNGVVGTTTGTVTENGGTLTLAGANTYSGTTTLTSGTLNFNNASAIGTGGFTITGGTLDNTSGAAITDSHNNTQAWNGNFAFTGTNDLNLGTGAVTMNASRQVTVNGGNLTVGGAISGATFGLTKLGGGTLILNGVVGTTTGSVTENGGALTLAGANTYSGGTTLTSGTINFNNAQAIGTGAFTISGGTLDNTSAAAITNSKNNTQNWNGDFTFTGTQNLNLGTGAVTLGGSRQVTVTGNTLTVGGVIDDGASTFDLTKAGSGTLALSGANTYGGTTTVNGGILLASNNSALGAGAGAVTVASNASLGLSATTNITKSSMLTLSGAGFTGTSGALYAAGASGTTSGYTGNITVGADATLGGGNNLLIVGNGSTFANTISLGTHTLTLNASAASTVVPTYLPVPAHTFDATSIVINSNIGDSGGITKIGAGTATIVNTGNSTFTGNTTVLAGKLIVDSYDGYNAVISSNEVVVGNAVSPGSGNTVVLQMGQAANTPSSSNIIGVYNPVTNASASNLTIYSDGVFKMNNGSNGFVNLTLEGGHVDGGLIANHPLLSLTGSLATNASSTTALIEHGNLALGANNFNFTIAGGGTTASGFDLQIDSIVQNGVGYTAGTSGTSILKLGAGTLALTNANTYSGITDIRTGVLNIQNGSALGQTGSFLGDTLSGTLVESGAQLQLQGSITVSQFETLTLNGAGVGNTGALRSTGTAGTANVYNGFVNLQSDSRINADSGTTLTIANTNGVNATILNGLTAGQNLTVGGAGNTTINGGVSSFVNNLTKDGSGTLNLAGSNAYAGTTNVTAGTLEVTHSNGLSGTGVTVSAGATLQFAKDGSNANVNVVGVASTINGTGVGGGGAVQNLNGTNSYLGAVTLGSASLITAVTGSSLTLSGNVDTAGYDLSLGTGTNQGALTISGNVTGGGGLIKDGSGGLTLSGTGTNSVGAVNLYTGTTTVSTGTTLTSTGIGFSSATFGGTANSLGTGATLSIAGQVTANLAANTTNYFNGSLAGAGTLRINGTNQVGATPGSVLVFDHSTGFNASSLSLQFGGGTIQFINTNGSGTSNFQFASIEITGNTILDFGNSAGTFLTTGTLTIDPGATLTINRWVSVTNNTSASTVFYVNGSITGIGALGGTSLVGNAPLGNITFTNYGGLTTTWVSGTTNGWFDHEIRPTPEPATYGALLIGGCLGLMGWRRLRRRARA